MSTQIHLHAEPGAYAPVVLLPGDPNRATRMAARLDGGLDGTTLVNANRGLLGYTGTLSGVPLSIQTTMMGTPTTSIVVEELINLGCTTFIRVGTTGGYRGTNLGDVVVAMAAAAYTGIGTVLGRGEPTAPTADYGVVQALDAAAREAGLTTHVGPIVTSDVFYDPTPDASRWGARGYLSAEMESAAVFLLAMRERGKGRPVRAGTILTVSDVILGAEAQRPGDAPSAAGWERLPEEELQRRIDLTIGAALTAAANLGRE